MRNIAALLKSEIARVARREVRHETEALRKAIGSHRNEIAALKRRAKALEAQLRRQRELQARARPAAESAPTPPARRYSAKGLAALRRRLGLSAQEFGLLMGTSSQSIYNWEAGKSRPRSAHLEAIAAMRSWGKRQVALRLAAAREAA